MEDTWPSAAPIVFVGGWCLRYSRRDFWGSKHYTVAPYHWDDREQIPRDLQYLSDVYETLLPRLAVNLNRIHGVDRSVRYWRIVAGWWLFYFIQIFFDRWQVMRSASGDHPGARMLRIGEGKEHPASVNMARFLSDMASDAWNERLLADIAERWTDIQVTEVVASRVTRRETELDEKRPVRRWSLRAISKQLSNWLSDLPIFFGEGVAVGPDCASRWDRLKLAILLGQFPRIGAEFYPSIRPIKPALRQWVLEVDAEDDFVQALVTLVPQYLPACYVEDFDEMSKLALKNHGNGNPRVIVTASAFEADDCWKMWAALQCERGTKLVIEQHGGHYGAGAWSASQMHEIAISDRFLTWGWTDSREPKLHRAPAMRLVDYRKREPNQKGYCLQVTCSLPVQSYWMYSIPVGPQVVDHIEDQMRFAAALSNEVRKDLLVRLFPQEHGWEIGDRWRDAEPLIATDAGALDLRKLLNETKLYVATYNATTFLESFTRGIPTVMFWNPKFWELSEEAAPFYDALRRASVLFDDPHSCAMHVNSIWDDVPSWWSSVQVQSAVEEFCENYAYIGKRPLREFKDALTTWPSP